ncbi:MAG: multicopper oxidase family protein [Hydrotalea sp.]|nr:multicopper oxidase family protein [Hydrotalea sp.]
MATNFLHQRHTKWLSLGLLLVIGSILFVWFSHDDIFEDKVAPPTLTSLSLKPGKPFRQLVALKNDSKTSGTFIGTLTAMVKNIPSKPHRIFQQATSLMLYNGYLPGPLVEVKAGDHVKIKFINKLAKDTTVHFHGLPIPPEQDGNPMEVVRPEKSRVYDFLIPADTQGSYWYHPHPHQLVAMQAASGLAGAMIVRAKNDPLAALGITEQNIFINGLRLSNGQIDKNNQMDWQHGRMGETLLVNGVVQPVLTVNPGSTQRLRIWNATNGRFMTLVWKKGTDPDAPNTDVKTYLVGTDGGLIPRPYLLGGDGVMLTSAQRRELVVRFDGKPGDVYTLFEQYPKLPELATAAGNENAGDAMAGMDMNMGSAGNSHNMAGMDMNMGDAGNSHNMAGMDMNMGSAGNSHNMAGMSMNMGGMDAMPGMEAGVQKPLMTVKLGNGPVEKPIALPDNLRSIQPLPPTAIKKKLAFTGVLADVSINNKKFDMKSIEYVSKKGTVEEWSVVNRADMTHPLHIHGGQFQVVSRELDGVVKKPPYVAWEDTIAVLPGETVVLRMKQDFVGIRMIHCHILEHEERGMMATINVVE